MRLLVTPHYPQFSFDSGPYNVSPPRFYLITICVHSLPALMLHRAVLCGIGGMSCGAIGVVWDQWHVLWCDGVVWNRWHVLWCDWCCVGSVACFVVLLVLCGIGGMFCGAIGVVRSVACLVVRLVLCGIGGMSCGAIGVVWDRWHVLWCDWCCEIGGMFCGAIGVVRSVACLVVRLVL